MSEEYQYVRDLTALQMPGEIRAAALRFIRAYTCEAWEARMLDAECLKLRWGEVVRDWRFPAAPRFGVLISVLPFGNAVFSVRAYVEDGLRRDQFVKMGLQWVDNPGFPMPTMQEVMIRLGVSKPPPMPEPRLDEGTRWLDESLSYKKFVNLLIQVDIAMDRAGRPFDPFGWNKQ